MALASNSLLLQSRMALGLTQQAFGDIVGLTKRTIQRWEERGATLTPLEVEALAQALNPVRPDLAAEIAAAADTTLERLGIAPAEARSSMASSDPVESVVRAAADVMRVTPDAIRPAIAAAFARASEVGLDVQAVAEILKQP
jgi:transcriptional regulator with XRE-family HTH domain